jgi:hypothetical protein
MRISTAVGYALSASAALAMLAGCSGVGSQSAPTPLVQAPGNRSLSVHRQVVQNGRTNNSVLAPNLAFVSNHPITTPSFMSPDAAAKPLLFITDNGNSVVDIYLQSNRTMVGQVTHLTNPEGIATDTARNLYVTNGYSLNVLVFAPPYTNAPKLTLADSGGFPSDVAVSRLGVVAVANQCSAPNCNINTGSVTFFAKNSKTACVTVADTTNFGLVRNAAFDNAGNLYIKGFSSTAQKVVGKIIGGCKAKKIILLKTTNSLGWDGGGIQIDKSGRIAVLDYQNGFVIFTYNPPTNGSLGSPITTTPLTGSSSPQAFAFLASGLDLFTADDSPGVSNEYDYAAGGAAESTINVGGLPFGVAASPRLLL